jgi:multidrug efflux pump subunit AcrA (membrane-fusion protein)
VVLEQVEDAIIVPEPALLTRDGHKGVFLLSPDGRSAHWRRVEAGIQQGERVEVRGEDLVGQVVVLGQQLLDDGSPVRVASEAGFANP